MESWLLFFFASFFASLALAWAAAKFTPKTNPLLIAVVALAGLITLCLLSLQGDEFGFWALELAFGLCSSAMGALFGAFVWAQFFKRYPTQS